jgi:hypothetical protein
MLQSECPPELKSGDLVRITLHDGHVREGHYCTQTVDGIFVQHRHSEDLRFFRWSRIAKLEIGKEISTGL